MHIYPTISGTLLSWKACKSLGILPGCYPNPITPHQQINQFTEHNNTSSTPEPLTLDNIMKEFPNVFDGQIRTMTGEELHISLIDDAKPFCVNMPRPFNTIHVS